MNYPERYILSISDLTKNIKSILEGNFPEVWVNGEVSNLRIPSSGHMYFTLKDENSQIKAVMFRNRFAFLQCKLEDGMKVIVRGSITVYEKRGEYQILVKELQSAGVGSLYVALEQLKQRLKKEGLFDILHKKPIPMIPQRVGIVTSPTGAAIRDILNIITRRFYNIEVLINPVRVQGEEAPGEIVQAIKEFNKLDKKLDVLIVTRGGGSIEDLWAFNDELVARAIFDSKIPVISAVGHETDFTIADFVADMRAPTPSAAAELVVKNKEELNETLNSFLARLKSTINAQLAQLFARLQRCQQSPVFIHPYQNIIQFQQRVDDAINTILLLSSHLMEQKNAQLHNLTDRLTTLSPLAILSRGYSITSKLHTGELIKNVAQVKIDDDLNIRVHQGHMLAKVCRVGEI
ncbi:MAG: exodeoxyribonuclease VII large subunit [bacterium]